MGPVRKYGPQEAPPDKRVEVKAPIAEKFRIAVADKNNP
jgi:hypothetical protein